MKSADNQATTHAATEPVKPLSVKEIGIIAHSKLIIDLNTDVFEEYFAPPYLQHCWFLESGTGPVKAWKNINLPGTKATILRVICEGDIVVFHQYIKNYTPMPDAFGVDFYRLRNGKIVEHWDAMEAAYGGQPSEQLLAGPTDVEDLNMTEHNRELVRLFAKKVLVGGDVSQMGSYLAENFTQHCPLIGKGAAGLEQFLHQRIHIWKRFSRVLAEGNFVWSCCEGSVGGKPYVFYDLFRVQNLKIVDQWRVKQPVPDKTASGLPQLFE